MSVQTNNLQQNESIKPLWEQTLTLLQDQPDVSSELLGTFTGHLFPLDLNNKGLFTLGMPSAYSKSSFEKNLKPAVVSTLRQVTGVDNLDVIVEILESEQLSQLTAHQDSSTALNQQQTISSHQSASDKIRESIVGKTGAPAHTNGSVPASSLRSSHPSNAYNDIILNTSLKFDTFVVGDSNNFAYSSALAVAEAPGLSYNPLFIWGASGLGKTHLLHAIGNHVNEIYPDKRIVFTTAKRFTEEYVKSIIKSKEQAVTAEKLRNHYRNADVLLIDDIQDLKAASETSVQFFHTFNHLLERNKQIVLVADRSPDELKLDERFVSRFKFGLMVDVLPPTYEMRCAILRNLISRGNGLPYTDDAIEYIAEKSSDNIRELEGAVTRINAFAIFKIGATDEVTLDIVKKAIPNFFPEREAKPLSISMIQKEVCRYFEVSHSDLIGKKRKREIVFPRHVAMFLCSELTESSYPQTGKAFGGRDHTTVMHAVDKIKKEINSNSETFDQIQYLTKILRTKTI
ncbi:MAG: chromosomal replication initiator protein DnaA [Coriobacteriia bacterium]|nr:chromosomal replication initiator protein DnaA [Coriobacteriia bacterium]MCL2537124.1 chromosomal replication initiator protein DnaA [Coriobacteriia bacterium]